MKRKEGILVPLNVSKQILTIGPGYNPPRGGVGAVIEIYCKYFSQFQFIKSHGTGSAFIKLIVFLKSVVLLFTLLIIKRNIKIIHLHGASYGSFYRKFVYFVIAKFIFGKKIIYHIHGAKYHLFFSKNNKIIKKLITFFINRVDCIICLSLSWKEFFQLNFEPKRIEILPNIIDTPKSNVTKKKSDKLTFLFLGFIGIRKGIFDLIEVMAINKMKYQNKLKLVIGGNGEIKELKRKIKEQHLESFVEFAGWVSNHEKVSLLQNTDVYILPSYNEGLPISILEAMSYQHPIITTKVGGIPEIVKPNKNGILVTPGNLPEIESAIDFFIQHPDKIKDYGKVSEQFSKKHLPENVLNELLHIYYDMLPK